MIKNVILKYPNETIIPANKICSYQIISLEKRYLLYTLNEMDGDNVFVYFGELIQQNKQLIMENVKSENLEVFKKFLVALATNSLPKENAEFQLMVNDLNNQTILVTGGGKTKMSVTSVSSNFHDIKKEEIEEILFDDLEEEVVVIPAAEEQVEKKLEETKGVPEAKLPAEEKIEEVKMEEPEKIEIVLEEKSKEEENLVEESKENIVETDTVSKGQKKKNKFLPVLISLCVLVVVIGGLVAGYFWIKENNRKADENKKPTEEHATLTLEQIGQKMRTGNFVQKITEENGEVLITTTSTELVFKIKTDTNFEYHYVWKSNALYTTIAKTDSLGMELSHHIYASIQELLGNDRNAVLNKITIGFENPTLEKEGIAILADGDHYNIQISTKNKLDLTAAIVTGPIEANLFRSYKDALTSPESLTLQTGAVSFIKSATEDSIDILIVEKGTLTDDSYQTFLNYLLAAYNDETRNTFQEAYQGFSVGDSEILNYKITLNGELDLEYQTKYPSSEYQWVQVHMTKEER